jgi:hypothetical protein
MPRGLAQIAARATPFLAAVVLVAGGFVLGRPAVRAQTSGTSVALACYRAAQSQTMLNNQLTVALCSGASSMAPLECFLAGDQSGLLSQDALVVLCRCTQDMEPMECFRRAQQDSSLTIELAVALCSPSVQQSLLTNCVPLSGPTPPVE